MSELKFNTQRPIVCVQGLGFVGSAMAIAVALAKGTDGKPTYNVVGIDLPNKMGKLRVDSLNKGIFPFSTSDEKLKRASAQVIEQGNFISQTSNEAYAVADVVVVDIPLDVYFEHPEKSIEVPFDGFKKAIETFASQIKENCLVLVETTVPPGTCENVVYPILKKQFEARGLDPSKIKLAHSYERVMPGAEYLDSIINFWRVFSGYDEISADVCESFLKTIVNTEEFPLHRLDKPIQSETSKVLENSYRAMTIAFMEEWGRFAEKTGFDLFKVINGIRVRPTHSNIRQPGFGVGGYCLTKDPLFAKWAAKEFFSLENEFEFCTKAVVRNIKMPIVTVNELERLLGDLSGKSIALYGVSYRQDVGDTRKSPSEDFVREVEKRGGSVNCYDPLVSTWEELEREVSSTFGNFDGYDAVVFAVNHREFVSLELSKLPESLVVLDANCVLTERQLRDVVNNNNKLFSIGRGESI